MYTKGNVRNGYGTDVFTRQKFVLGLKIDMCKQMGLDSSKLHIRHFKF